MERLTQRAPDWWESARFQAFAWLEAGSGKMAFSCPTHQRVTQAVGQLKKQNINSSMNGKPMTLVQSPITHDVIEKRYVYRYSWTSTLLMLIIGGLSTSGMVMTASTKGTIWLWLLAGVSFFVFLMGAWITIINFRDNLRFMISRDGVYIPMVWNSNRHTFIPFSRVTAVEFFNAQGNLI